jgi:uncharacterized protein
MSEDEPGGAGTARRLEPLGLRERVDLIDILRGLAILGILFVNIGVFSFPEGFERFHDEIFAGKADLAVKWAIRFLVEGKFYTLFSFLFGLGVAVQSSRALQRGRRFAPLYCRRLLVLLGIGLVHDLFLWNGRILIAYALLGFLLIPFHKRRPKTLLVWALILILLPLLLVPLMSLARRAAPPAPREEVSAEQMLEEREQMREEREQEMRGEFEDQLRLFREGDYAEMVGFRVRALSQTVRAVLVFGPYMLGIFLLGMWTWKKGILQRPGEHLVLIRRVQWWGLAVGVLGNLAFLLVPELLRQPVVLVRLTFGLGFLAGNPALCLFYAASVVRLAGNPRCRTALGAVIPVGRMALSNYFLQTLVCTTLFYGYGLGLFGKTGPLLNLAVILFVFVLAIVASNLWARRFRFGPAEWLWRTLTYWKVQPLKL